MRLKTILNNTEKYTSFVFGNAAFHKSFDGQTWDKPVIIANIEFRKNSKPICSVCNNKGTAYDRLPNRLFEHVPLWGIKVYFSYRMRRVDCKHCNSPKVESVPWSDGKKTITKSFEWFLSEWAKQISWDAVSQKFNVSWDMVHRAIQMAVAWGLFHRDISNIRSIGVDEIAKGKGHNYVTLVYQIDQDQKRLLWVGQNREEQTLEAFFTLIGKERSAKIEAVASDMWKPYINVIKAKIPQAVHVLDRYHIMSNMNKAIDEVRATEVKDLQAKGLMPVLKKTRFIFLKRPENLTENQEVKLAELLKYNLKSVKSYLLKEDFQNFWEYTSVKWAEKFMDNWCAQVMRSKIEPMKKMAKQLRNHKKLILNWFVMKGEISSGIVEGFNNKAKVTTRKSYGFRTYEAQRIALLHQLGDLPVPNFTHKY